MSTPLENWIFLEQGDWGARRIDPPEAYFFSNLPAIGAVIREGVQNLLDARDPDLNPSTPVKARFSIHQGNQALAPEKARFYLGRLNEHLVASGFDAIPNLGNGMPYLVVEDFGTLGLIGNTGPDAESEDNRFYWFHRNINRTQQREDRGGSYGYGKAAFSLASKIRSFFTVSYGADGTKRVFGNSILKTHDIDGRTFGPYGDFGIGQQIEGRGEGVVPSDEQEFFKSVCADFSLEREKSSGLSVIVPFPERIYTVAEMAESAIRNYLVPICQGKIVFEITDGNSPPIEISKSSISSISNRLMWDGEIPGAMSQTSRNSMDSMIDLALWWDEHGADVAIPLEPLSDREPHWYPSLIPENDLDSLKSRIARGEPLALSVEIPLRRFGARNHETGKFTVLLMKRDDQGASDALWFRKYISVPQRPEIFSGSGYVAITIADEDCILEEMLRKSEDVAHTNHNYKLVREGYKYAQGTIRFYRKAGKHLLEYLTSETPELEEGWLSEWFPTEELERENTNPRRARRKSTRRKKDDIEDDTVTGPSQPPEDLSRNHSWDVHKRSGGFSIEGSITHDLIYTFSVKTAYARDDGADPLKKWKKFDFDLSDESQFFIEDSGGVVYNTVEGNEIIFSIEGPVEDYFVEISGFEVEGRDVYVKARPRLSRRDA